MHDRMHLKISGGSILLTRRPSPEGDSFGLTVCSGELADAEAMSAGEVDESAYFDAHGMRALAYTILSMVDD